MRTAFLITAKDLRQRLRDRSAFLVAIVAPLALAFALSVTISGFSAGSETFQIGLVDLDHGRAAANLRNASAKPGSPLDLRDLATEAEGRSLVEAGKLDGAIVLPRGLSAASVGGPPVQIDVLGDPKNPIGALVAGSIADSFASYTRTIRVAAKALAAGPAETHPDRRERRLVAAADLDQRHLDNQEEPRPEDLLLGRRWPSSSSSSPSSSGSRACSTSARDGTLARMLAAPIPRRSILAGKAMTSLALGLTSMTVLALTTRFALGAHWGNPLGVAALIVCAVLAATAVTAFVTTLAKTADQANAWLSIVGVVLGMLGGSFFPVAQAGGLLAALSKVDAARLVPERSPGSLQRRIG